MTELRVCFVGIGSIANRHIRNLRAICGYRNIRLSIDAFRRSGDVVDGVDTLFHDTDCVPDNYDAIFITNPTEYHLNTLKAFHMKGKHFFIEKPLVSIGQIHEAEQFMRKNNSVYYVACPLRYNAVIQYIKKSIVRDEVISVRSISSSYLPEWRLGQDYRNSYSAKKDMGGGVSIDLIHEWDYLTYIYGWPKKVFYLGGKKSPLEIDSDDYAIYIAETEKQIIELHLDYFGRQTIRKIELFCKDYTIVGDIANNRIIIQPSGEIIDFHEERDDYQRRELEYFLDMVMGAVEIEDGYDHALDVLKLTQGEL